MALEAHTMKTEVGKAKAEYLKQEAHMKPLRDEINKATADANRADVTLEEQVC